MALDSAPHPTDAAISHLWHFIETRGLDLDVGSSQDPRQGSARNDSSGGGTLSQTAGSKGSSLGKLGTTFIPVSVFTAVCLVIFIVLRRFCKRVYAPRTIPELRSPDVPSPALPGGWLNWIIPFFKTPDTIVLNHGSLDGFFFLRFLKVLRNICLAGCLITFPVLFPIHATGGSGLTQLEMLTIGNVKDPQKLLAHVFVAWAFFGFVLYMIVRECIYYVNLRQAYLSSPYYADRISSRTILLTCVPKEYLDERRLRKLYGDSVRRVFIPRTSKALVKMVKEREQTAERLEKAEIALIRIANLARQKKLAKDSKLAEPSTAAASITESTGSKEDLVVVPSDSTANDTCRGDLDEAESPGSIICLESLRRNPDKDDDDTSQHEGIKLNSIMADEDEKLDQDDGEYEHPYGLSMDLPDVRGSVAAQWIPVQRRPYHRPIGNFGRRVDTIRWTRSRLRDLNLQIFKMRRQVRRGDGITLPSVFIEFHTQEAAQAAHQVLTHHRPLQMSSRLLGIRPDEIIWSCLRMPWWELIIRRFGVLTLVTAAIIFWAVPSAFIGTISNIEGLTQKIKFLSFLNKLPSVILNFIQSFMPAVVLSLWMAAVPWMLRFCGAQSGIPTVTRVELFVQNVYFAFQVVQVFLITTLTSAASSALGKILSNPLGAKDLLAENIPKASNFYLSYIMIQCLMSGGMRLIQVFGLIRHYIVSRVSAVPRTRYKRWCKLESAYWGGVYPIYTNMGVIALSYSCIAPLVLLFAAGGLFATQVVWKYNLIYVLDSDMDTKGLFYPRALIHLTIGLYLAEICLIGLFALKGAFAPLALMVLFFIFTGLVHFSLSDAIAPLLLNLPQTLPLEGEIQAEERAKALREKELATARLEGEDGATGAANDYYDSEQVFGDDERMEQSDTEEEEEEEDSGDEHGPITGTRAVEGAASIGSTLKEWAKATTQAKVNKEINSPGVQEFLAKIQFWKHDKHGNSEPPGFLARWLHPEEYEDFVALRNTIPGDQLRHVEYPSKFRKRCYLPPEMWAPKPTLWIPRDEARVSRQEVAHTKKYTPISDKGAELDEKGGVVVYFDKAPIKKDRMLL
ncbi:DUF221 domain-containing protein [Metarhizium guizhouense ARSEF 977]|uniref:DUF221 domain-containing protein n=1 Tax=Metarhizium guizhouense (strain ARSEF 977) TaxID=1276136 RepID=A0A0B4GD46_METGA|nr:DUF221 domain-containing protein [Metarhizium guizhouense ARSEF 977]